MPSCFIIVFQAFALLCFHSDRGGLQHNANKLRSRPPRRASVHPRSTPSRQLACKVVCQSSLKLVVYKLWLEGWRYIINMQNPNCSLIHWEATNTWCGSEASIWSGVMSQASPQNPASLCCSLLITHRFKWRTACREVAQLPKPLVQRRLPPHKLSTGKLLTYFQDIVLLELSTAWINTAKYLSIET